VTTGVLHDVPLPYPPHTLPKAENLSRVAGSLISGMIREGEREDFYEKDPSACPK